MLRTLGWILCFTLPAAAQDESRWTVITTTDAFEDFHIAPASPPLNQAIHDAAEYVLRWKLPASAQAWSKRRIEVERALRKAIGLETLPPGTPLQARIIATHDFGDHTLANVVFESRPGFPVTANLYRPKAPAKGKRPAVLCPIGHHLDLGKTSEEVQIRSIHLARMGYVVLAYDAIGQGERLIPGNIHHEAGYALFPVGETITGWLVWDSMRAIDYLCSLEEVDPSRIGVTGNSGGGLNTLYTAALDSRVRAAVISGFIYEFHDWMKYAGSHCTCTQLPGLYRAMEWFEIAGLIAPRPVLMLHGERDDIFPLSGARRSGRAVEALYALLGRKELARLDVVPGEPHAYSRPFRERMYGWMARHLLGQGRGDPLAEGSIRPLDPRDRRLLCFPPDSHTAEPISVVALARRKGDELFSRLPLEGSAPVRASARKLVAELTAPPYDEPHYLRPDMIGRVEIPRGVLEKVYFVSEVGVPVPGLLWLPKGRTAPRVVILVDDRGKQAVAESGLVEPLVEAGYAVLSVDLRGRGETLGQMGRGSTNNFHFVKHSILWGSPLAGRRAFDLMRTIDYLALRGGLSLDQLAVVGISDDALPVLLAAAADPRIRQVAAAGYVSSFLSQMIHAALPNRSERVREWNMTAMRTGRIQGEHYAVDLGSVIPSVLETADLPDFVSLIAPRRVLFCGTRDQGAPGADTFRSRFERVTRSNGAAWIRYAPDKTLDSALLMAWLKEGRKP